MVALGRIATAGRRPVQHIVLAGAVHHDSDVSGGVGDQAGRPSLRASYAPEVRVGSPDRSDALRPSSPRPNKQMPNSGPGDGPGAPPSSWRRAARFSAAAASGSVPTVETGRIVSADARALARKASVPRGYCRSDRRM